MSVKGVDTTANEGAGTMTVIEICVDTLEGVEAARVGGADRVELCRELWCGGLTPPDDLITAALPLCPADGLQVLVRSRPGDFVYTDDEISAMCADIERIGKIFAGAPVPCGFVVGALTANGLIDDVAALRFREAAGQYLSDHVQGSWESVPSVPYPVPRHLGWNPTSIEEPRVRQGSPRPSRSPASVKEPCACRGSLRRLSWHPRPPTSPKIRLPLDPPASRPPFLSKEMSFLEKIAHFDASCPLNSFRKTQSFRS